MAHHLSIKAFEIMLNFVKKSASLTRHRITFLRHRCFSICVIARHRNKDAHIADYKRVTVASWVVRHSYIYKYIYGALAPNILIHIKKAARNNNFKRVKF